MSDKYQFFLSEYDETLSPGDVVRVARLIERGEKDWEHDWPSDIAVGDELEIHSVQRDCVTVSLTQREFFFLRYISLPHFALEKVGRSEATKPLDVSRFVEKRLDIALGYGLSRERLRHFYVDFIDGFD